MPKAKLSKRKGDEINLAELNHLLWNPLIMFGHFFPVGKVEVGDSFGSRTAGGNIPGCYNT